MKVELFYFDGCPHVEATEERIRSAAGDLGLAVEIEQVEVGGEEDARRLGFLGSPTVRVNGEDVEPEARGRADHVFGCRLYRNSGVPPREWILVALATGGAA
jgi:hypothetical protein